MLESWNVQSPSALEVLLMLNRLTFSWINVDIYVRELFLIWWHQLAFQETLFFGVSPFGDSSVKQKILRIFCLIVINFTKN